MKKWLIIGGIILVFAIILFFIFAKSSKTEVVKTESEIISDLNKVYPGWASYTALEKRKAIDEYKEKMKIAKVEKDRAILNSQKGGR